MFFMIIPFFTYPCHQAGTTTWNKYLLLLSNLPPDLKERWSRDDIELYRFGGTLYNAGPLLRYNPQIEATNMDINEVQGFLKFSFVRNPIDRHV